MQIQLAGTLYDNLKQKQMRQSLSAGHQTSVKTKKEYFMGDRFMIALPSVNLEQLATPQKNARVSFDQSPNPPLGPLLNYSEMVLGSSEDIFQRKNMRMHGCNVLVHQSCERREGVLVCYISLLEAHRF